MTSGGGGHHGPPQKPPDQHHRHLSPGQVSSTPAWAGTRALGGATNINNRTFAQIIEEEKLNRNIIEIHITKQTSKEEEEKNSSRGITFDDLGELIFDVVKIDPNDCLAFDYNTGRYDTRHIQLKAGVQTEKFVTTTPIIFKGHAVNIKKLLNNITRVTFKNVPLNVPNEEIIHLCKSYGKPLDNKVYFETLTNSRNKGMRGSTRFVDMELNKGANMMNYYWMEGPLSGDQGRRVLVLHNGQVSQCSHCLRKAVQGGCPAGGNGKACFLMETPRAKMLNYMQSLKSQVGYVSLKSKYVEQQARSFPSLPGFDSDIISNMEENNDLEDLVPINPIEEKDKKIAALEKTVDRMKNKDEEINQLKELLCKTTAELKTAKNSHNTTLKKLDFTQKATEKRLVDSISDPAGFHADPVLIGVYSATLDEGEFDFEETSESEDSRSRKDKFLKEMEDKVDLKNPEHKERFMEVKNQILDKVKATQVSRMRSRSASAASQSSKRDRSSDSQSMENGRSPVRPRTGIPKKM